MAENFGKDRFWNRGPTLDLQRFVHFRPEFWKTDISATNLPAPWTLTDTSSSGTPTIVQSGDAHGGAIELKHSSTSEAQRFRLKQGHGSSGSSWSTPNLSHHSHRAALPPLTSNWRHSSDDQSNHQPVPLERSASQEHEHPVR